MRKYLIAGVGLLALVAATVALVPALRYQVQGRLGGEPMVQGQPASYWVYAVREAGTTRERAEAADALGQLGSQAPAEAAAALTRALSDPEPSVRRTAAHALGTVGAAEGAAGPLLTALDDKDGGVRGAAADALGDLRPSDPAVVPALHARAKADGHLPARLAAIAALGRFGDRAAEVVPTLIDTLKEPDSPLGSPHEFAAVALKAIGPATLPAVTEALGRPESRTRIGALKVFAGLGAAARPAVPEVEKRLADKDPLVRLEAVHALWAVERNPDRAVAAALEHLRTAEPIARVRGQTRAKAIYILGEVGPAAKTAVPELLIILRDDPESSIRTHTARALGKMGRDPAVVAALEAAAKGDKDPDVCGAAHEALKNLEPRS
jgi:HEAT repeat protein